MNREIKFRAWDKKDKEMFMVDAINFNNGYLFLLSNKEKNLSVFNKGKNIELMQSTGLTDKNGKEIYESDLVNVEFNDGSKYEDPLEIYFEKGAFMVGMGYLLNVKSIEVIGNIYENPNLLNKEK